MKSKVLLLALATTAFALGTKAQEKTTFGVRAGVNFTNLNSEEGDGTENDNRIKTGVNIGVNAEIPVAPQFYVQPGLLFSTKGARAEKGNNKIAISYLEIPINLLFKPELGDGKLLLGFGPYIGIGVGGKFKRDRADGGDLDIEFTNDVKPEDLNKPMYPMKRLDFGGNLLVGYELSNKISVQLNAQLGMTNLEPKWNGEKPDAKTKNTGFGFSVGYRF